LGGHSQGEPHPDGANITSATVSITGSYSSSTGEMTLSGTATVADYQAALRSVEFASTDTSTSPAARTVSFTVTDADSETSNTAM
jgi:hypothetical protein